MKKKTDIKIRIFGIWICIGIILSIISSQISFLVYTNLTQRFFVALFLIVGFILGYYGKNINEYIMKILK